MPTNLNKLLVLAADDEARFWALREAAWAPLGAGIGQARHELAARLPGSRADTSLVVGALPVFLETLASHCRGLPGDELATLDRVLERQLYEIDRADIHLEVFRAVFDRGPRIGDLACIWQGNGGSVSVEGDTRVVLAWYVRPGSRPSRPPERYVAQAR
jgi:hypothetical protein